MSYHKNFQKKICFHENLIFFLLTNQHTFKRQKQHACVLHSGLCKIKKLVYAHILLYICLFYVAIYASRIYHISNKYPFTHLFERDHKDGRMNGSWNCYIGNENNFNKSTFTNFKNPIFLTAFSTIIFYNYTWS